MERRPRSATHRGKALRRGDVRAKEKRPSSACETARAKWGRAGREMGDTPWVASIGGGIHTSYTAIGQPQVQPTMADPRRSARSTPPAPAAPGFELKVAIPSAHGLVDKRELPLSDDPLRRLTFCPRMRAKGYCRLPSCTFVHEVCRPRREFDPLYCANAPRFCSMLPCRFFTVLGSCPHGESCIYSHDIKPPEPPMSQAWTEKETEETQATQLETPQGSEEPTVQHTQSVAESKASRATESSIEMPRPAAVKKAPGPKVRRPRSSKHQRPILPQMASLGCPPDLGCPGKDRPVSGGIPVLNMMADRRVCVTAG